MITFIVTDFCEQEISKWVKEHMKVCGYRPTRDCEICESPLSYCFRPNSIADALTIRCLCGAEQFIDDTHMW